MYSHVLSARMSSSSSYESHAPITVRGNTREHRLPATWTPSVHLGVHVFSRIYTSISSQHTLTSEHRTSCHNALQLVMDNIL